MIMSGIWYSQILQVWNAHRYPVCMVVYCTPCLCTVVKMMVNNGCLEIIRYCLIFTPFYTLNLIFARNSVYITLILFFWSAQQLLHINLIFSFDKLHTNVACWKCCLQPFHLVSQHNLWLRITKSDNCWNILKILVKYCLRVGRTKFLKGYIIPS